MLSLLRGRPGEHPDWKALDRYTAASSAVYRSIAHVTGARVVVDSSRLPIEPVALGLVPGVDVRVAQVIRDPRAVVYSWKRSKQTTDRDDPEYMPKFGASFSTTSWLARNSSSKRSGAAVRSRSCSTTTMARDPAAVLRRLAEFVGEPAGDLDFLDVGDRDARADPLGRRQSRAHDRAARSRSSPTRSGAPSIAAAGPRSSRTAIALPLLRRYGLPVRSGERSPAAAPGPVAEAARGRRAHRREAPVPRSRPMRGCASTRIRHGLRHRASRAPCSRSAPARAGSARGSPRHYTYTGVELDDRSRAAAEARIAAGGRGRSSTRSSPTSPTATSTSCARSRCSSTSPTTREALEAVARVPPARRVGCS